MGVLAEEDDGKKCDRDQHEKVFFVSSFAKIEPDWLSSFVDAIDACQR